ncbi:MAG: glycosyltransferase [Bacteroidetes bacterium]|nr:glycosyltransferase [Bacteroidota bacterium]
MFFYPAQFWAHKNHYNLLLAFKKLQNDFPDLKLVLTGSDKGNKEYIKEVVSKLDLKNHVLFPGFVDNETMVGFYSHASAMIMPSFWTNKYAAP